MAMAKTIHNNNTIHGNNNIIMDMIIRRHKIMTMAHRQQWDSEDSVLIILIMNLGISLILRELRLISVKYFKIDLNHTLVNIIKEFLVSYKKYQIWSIPYTNRSLIVRIVLGLTLPLI